MPKTFMRQVLCPTCPGEDGQKKVEMRFSYHRGPYDTWYDEQKKRTITKASAGSRCVREFWYCEKCNTVSWYDFLIDLPMSELPPVIRKWMMEKWHVLGG